MVHPLADLLVALHCLWIDGFLGAFILMLMSVTVHPHLHRLNSDFSLVKSIFSGNFRTVCVGHIIFACFDHILVISPLVLVVFCLS